MTKEKFVLVSLKEDKAKELAQVISNESCRKILDYLAEKQDATETDLAEKLNIPISTVHYNMKHLLAGGLITAEEYHYSKKGKEVNHYKLANKYIIIAPKTTHGIKEKLKSILPVGLLALAGAGAIQIYNSIFGRTQTFAAMKAAPSNAVMEEAVATGAADAAAAPVMEAAVKAEEEVARAVVEEAPEVVQQVTQAAAPNLALWFLFGCLFVIALIIIFELVKAKRENK